MNGAGYQSFFNTWTAKGYVPVLVSATGPVANATFAAVFEQGIVGPWVARPGSIETYIDRISQPGAAPVLLTPPPG